MKGGNVKSETVRIEELWLRTFFCNRITLVHFFSNSPTYFPFGSGVYSKPVSALSALKASVKLLACRYSRIDF